MDRDDIAGTAMHSSTIKVTGSASIFDAGAIALKEDPLIFTKET
jgi:hypothetical protein